MSDNSIKNIVDNTPGHELTNVLKDQLKKSKYAKFAIGYFFLSGFSLIKEDFPDTVDEQPFLKIIMGNETTIPTKDELSEGYSLRNSLQLQMIGDLQQSEVNDVQVNNLRNLKDLIANNIIDVKLFDSSRLHAKLYLFLTNPNEEFGSTGLATVGSSNFTASGLEINKELNVIVTERNEVQYLEDWFDELWDESIDFKEDLLKVIELSGALPESPYPRMGTYVDPETLFKYLVYNWFEGRVLNLLKRDVLMEFQIVGVLNAVDILNYYNGAIIADSVGLGKSFTASAIIEEFISGKHSSWVSEGEIPSVMLILPPSLISQWEDLLSIQETDDSESGFFLTQYSKNIVTDSNNHRVYEILNGDSKVIGKIGFMSLGVFQGYKVDDSKGYIDPELKKLAESYNLFVIDEAHKYRNKNTNRWKAIRKLRKKENGFSNKFLLLTATPLNNSIYDIYNLIRLFVDDTFSPFIMKGIPINELIKQYNDLKRELDQNNEDPVIKKELRRVATEIKQRILDETMILRTRKYITTQFKDININGKPLIFKDPLPYGVEYSSFATIKYRNFISLVTEKLNEINFEYTKLYGSRYVVFDEQSFDDDENKRNFIEIADLLKLLLGKRLESGVYSFETTLRRIREKERIFYDLFSSQMNKILNEDDLKDKIKSALEKAKINKELEDVLEEYNVEEEVEETWFDRVLKILFEYAEELIDPNKTYTDLEKLKLGLHKVLENLKNDLKTMDKILEILDEMKEKEDSSIKVIGKIPKHKDDIIELPIFVYTDDPKIESLKQLLGNPSRKSESLKDVPSLNGKKILLFTQYKDTAYYLYHNLLDWVSNDIDELIWLKDKSSGRIKIGLVSGETDTSTKVNFMKRFSPSANRGYEEISKSGDIEILISTDALSEGVNLQDADVVINYDLPWNPMIIVQRVGRVNRIGNEKDVSVINFIPSEEIEVIVGILSKLQEKIRDITYVVGKETRILDPDEEISVETFGEKIKDISNSSMTNLEEYGMSNDFKEFIPEGISEEQLAEYKLLNYIQYDLGYTNESFEDVANMDKNPYYSFIHGNEKLISIHEFYRGKYKILKKVMCIDSKTQEMTDESPLVFLDLIMNKKQNPQQIQSVIENLKIIDEESGKIKDKFQAEYEMEQRGFLYNLYNALLVEREKSAGMEDRFRIVMNTLQAIPYSLYTREIKPLLISKNMVDYVKSTVVLKDFKGTIDTLYDFFKIRGLIDIESLKIESYHYGWYYEI